MDEAAAVEARDVVHCYGPVKALDGLSLALEAGCVTGLLGPNGAGKSTLVGLLLGRWRPQAGRVCVCGQLPGSLAARALTGAMLQSAALAAQLTVAEHLRLHASYHRAARPLEQTLALAGLQALAGRRYGALSGGEQRRVQFALALCGRPRVLVLDEPSAALDAESRRALWQAVRTLADEGAAVLMTTHLLEEAEALSDRVVLLAAGRCLADGSPAQIRARVAAQSLQCLSSLPLERLRALPGVTAAEPRGRRVALRTQAAETTLRALLAADDTVAELELTATRLEDAVLDLLHRETA
ncbi:ABC transporter ATP-binding protein [Rubrivivax gelatinosus]|uniref:ABC transporter ATP-binding protein n=1 Tax=Rubrivivax gelatinosus (strain NBRC 100245 / IL144) TaxID=983917 RepID=I0HQI4_RUBGI|nr:ABC transporter ATP-binding protein [Rubrivivax gelatinosus]MBG6081805.1 ABC-2 type transport system ATP-binding protein [Rubrivivax gelatinosus]BAL95271.1 ABC transporter ATP-binding protein [Rubrivivax gelatinosus IL144]